jgi:NADH-quinone oxidoreductase subunit I
MQTRTWLRAFRTLSEGLRLTWSHMARRGRSGKPLPASDGNYFRQAPATVTIQYPIEQVPTPDTGRYRLHMETEDCIVCDKCARICPVDCIDIQGVKSQEDLGFTSDGSRKRIELQVFDIDMAKCCFCGLCTTVCPTECLTMTPVYDYSEFDRAQFTYSYGKEARS